MPNCEQDDCHQLIDLLTARERANCSTADTASSGNSLRCSALWCSCTCRDYPGEQPVSACVCVCVSPSAYRSLSCSQRDWATGRQRLRQQRRLNRAGAQQRLRSTPCARRLAVARTTRNSLCVKPSAAALNCARNDYSFAFGSENATRRELKRERVRRRCCQHLMAAESEWEPKPARRGRHKWVEVLCRAPAATALAWMCVYVRDNVRVLVDRRTRTHIPEFHASLQSVGAIMCVSSPMDVRLRCVCVTPEEASPNKEMLLTLLVPQTR